MSYPKQLLRLRPVRGLALDIPANEVSEKFYTLASNVHFRDGIARRMGGRRAAYAQNTVDPTLHLLNVRAPGGATESNFWLAFGADEVQALETSNIDDITPAAGLQAATSSWQWSTTLLNNIPCATNGLDAPFYWAGDVGTVAADLPNWPAGTVCKSLVAFKFHLFALDIDGPGGHFESQIKWSDAAAAGDVPATWTAAPSNEAGSATLADTPGPCMCGVPLQDSLLVFKRSSTYAVSYVAGSRIFSVRLLDGARGALTRHAAVDVGGKVLVVTDGDVMLTDGVNWQSVAQGRARNQIFTQLDQDNYENLTVEYDRAKDEVWICYPTSGNAHCSEALIYNVGGDTFGIRTLDELTHLRVGVVNDTANDESWDADSEVWDDDDSFWNSANFSLANEQLMTAVDGDELTLEDDETATAVAATLFRHDLTMGEPERLKFARRVHVRTNATPGTLYVRVGARNTPTESITWGAERPLVTPGGFVNCRALGAYISIEIRSEGEQVWQVTGIDIEFELRGYVRAVSSS